MAKLVADTAAGKSISALVILNKKGNEVARVHAHYSNGGRVAVDVFNFHDAAVNSLRTLARLYGDKAPDDAYLQQGAAGGYGYDKFAAAIRGLVIDGHELFDHCGQNDQTKALLKRYQKAMGKRTGNASDGSREWEKKADRIGARFANWTENGWASLHMVSGLDRLRGMGYRVISVL